MAEREKVGEGKVEAVGRGGGHDHLVSGPQFGKVSASAEGGRLARTYHYPPHIGSVEPFGKGPEFMDGLVREHVHRPAGAVEHQMDDAVGLIFEPELGELGQGHVAPVLFRRRPHRRP